MMTTFRTMATGLRIALYSAALLSCVALADEPQPNATATQGVWQKHDYSFAYFGFTTTYSCDGLADKLKVLLLAAGARKDAVARPGACSAGFGRPDKFARASLSFYTLSPVAADTAGTSTGGALRSVAITERSPRELRTGDCELVEQFRNKILGMFAARNVVSRTTCVPHQESGSSIDLTFESFAPLPDAKASASHPTSRLRGAWHVDGSTLTRLTKNAQASADSHPH